MIRYIVKRSGDKVSFDARKIKSAIFKANTRIAAERMSDADLNELTEEVLTALEKLPGTPTAQKIQNVVEEKLLAADYAKTANAYINYRTEHEHLREMDDELVKIFENLTFRPSEEDDLKRENANINADTAMGTMLKYGSESAKRFTINMSSRRRLPKHTRAATSTFTIKTFTPSPKHAVRLTF